jgi:hypothetical protein
VDNHNPNNVRHAPLQHCAYKKTCLVLRDFIAKRCVAVNVT